jgi:YHS domain-containing protein
MNALQPNQTPSLLVALTLIMSVSIASGQPDQAGAEQTAPTIALSGFDPVSYFDADSGDPRKGDAMYSQIYEGLEYRFVSSDHLMDFSISPDKYAPLFDGADPLQLVERKNIDADPRIYSVIDGGLYLFANQGSRDTWLQTFDELAPVALANWSGVDGDSPESRITESLDRNTGKHKLKKGIGAAGYDVVSYFPEGGGAPAKGSKKHQVEYRGVNYRFANARNARRFKERPTRYEPAFGGWCAYAVAHEGYTKPNPKRYLIQNDRLLLFYDGIAGDTYKLWHSEGPAKLEPLADLWWEKETGEKHQG